MLIFLALTACNRSGGNEQALAVVGDSEITHREVVENLDIRAADRTWSVDRGKLNLTLETLVQRRLLAQEARRQGLEKDATFHFAMRRAEEILLVEALQRKISKTIKRPSLAQISTYIRHQPWRFADRYRLLLVDGNIQLELDSFTLPRDNDLYARANVGNEIVIAGRRWVVVRRFEDPIDPMIARQLAVDGMVQTQVLNSLADLESQRRSSGVVRYRTGWGPSGR